MKVIFNLSAENTGLSAHELKLLNPGKISVSGRYAIADISSKKYLSRLALTRSACCIIQAASAKGIGRAISDISWKSYNDYSISVEGQRHFTTKEIAATVHDAFRAQGLRPRVNLSRPRNSIHFIFLDNKVIIGKLIYVNTDNFNRRKTHKRPEPHPSSLHPKLAKSLINLTGIKKGVILDPFCGAGGILIEAGLMGLRPVGIDTDQIMLNRARINLDHYNIRSYRLRKADSTKIKRRYKYIVTDLPYAKNTKKQDLNGLYTSFLLNLKKIVIRKAVVVFPDSIDYRKMVRKAGLSIEKEFSWYIHSSMTKKIAIITG